MVFGNVKRFERRILERVAADEESMDKVKIIGNKRFDDDGMARLSEVLQSNTSITSLQLSKNKIGDKGIGALADALHQNFDVERVDLSGNNIGDKGAAALAYCLQHHNLSVISLDLRKNGIGDDGAAALLAAASSNPTIHSINLEGNAIKSSLLKQIDEVVSRSKELFEKEVVYFDPSPTKKDEELAAAGTFSMTMSGSGSEGGNNSFYSSTDDSCAVISNNYVFQGAKVTSPNAESMSPSQLNTKGIAANWVNTFGTLFHDVEKNKEASGDSKIFKIIPVSDDVGYKAFLAFLRSTNVSDTNEDEVLPNVDASSITSSRPESVVETKEDQNLIEIDASSMTSLSGVGNESDMDEGQDMTELDAPSMPLSQSGGVSHSAPESSEAVEAQKTSEETNTAPAPPKDNPIEASLNWFGSLFHDEKLEKKSDDDGK